MSISTQPSAVTLPDVGPPYPSILEFLIRNFPHVAPQRWEERLRAGRILDERGAPITAATPYCPARRIYYFREVETEPAIPFTERIVFRNDEILVADKPHFLPVVPGGRYVNECLEQRLRDRTGLADLVPLHRIDRETAGLVMLSVNRRTRRLYHELFMHGRIEKTYVALARVTHPPAERQWIVENRIERGTPRFRMQIVPGIANARSRIELEEIVGNCARFRLQPVTGKTHQLRVHMSSLGFPILNDRYYPELEPERDDDFDRPLQLIAKQLRFHDPVSGAAMEFRSDLELADLAKPPPASARP